MPKYDFHHLLEPLEFEKLVCDVIQVRENNFVQMYKEGPDQGIDGSYTLNNKKTIIQAKRYKDYKALLSNLKTYELPKMLKEKPDRYILGVSLDFEPKHKKEICELFDGFILSEADILSQTDINRLLEDPKYKHVQAAHPKLWLPNSAILQTLFSKSMNRSLHTESALELKEAINAAQYFVPTELYRKALYSWVQKNVIIITGEPGVGKTTMAYLLALSHLQPDDLEGFVWANSIQDIYSMLDQEESKKQVFILDDFWGSVFNNDNTRRNDEVRLNKLIHRMNNFKGNKRLILTTREYIFQQGLQKQPALTETLNIHAVLCTVEQYSVAEKAQILFQHLYYSKLPYEYVVELFRKYEQIIQHSNYNPRVLASYLAKTSWTNISTEDYHLNLYEYFDNPEKLWEDVYKRLSDEAKIVVLLLLTASTPMLLNDMQMCYNKYVSTHPNSFHVKSLEKVISELDQTMLKSFYDENYDDICLSFISPAIQDFLYSYIGENQEQTIPEIIKSCCYFNQLQFLFEHFATNPSSRIIDILQNELIIHYEDYGYSYIESDQDNGRWDIDFVDDIPTAGEQLHRFFHLLKRCDPNIHLNLFKFLESKIKAYCLTMEHANMYAQYRDLHNFPNIILRCAEKGMQFDGEEIINKFHQEAFSIYHYRAMDDFKTVFPEQYAAYHKVNFPILKKNLKSILLNELLWLEDYDSDWELDMLIDNIPQLLKEFGLRYTHKFGEKIAAICGYMPPLNEKNKEKKPTMNYEHSDYKSPEEQLLETITEDTKTWILGPSEETLSEEQSIQFINRSKINPSAKTQLVQILQEEYDHYLYKYLQTKESLLLLLNAESSFDSNVLPAREIMLCLEMLHHLVDDDSFTETMELFKFCAEICSVFMYQEEPIMRKADFFSSLPYQTYLKDNPVLHEIVFNSLLLHDSQWVRFINIPIYLSCHISAFNIPLLLENEYDDLKIEMWRALFDHNIEVLQRSIKHKSIYEKDTFISEFYSYLPMNFHWQSTIYRMHQELVPEKFNQLYTAPKLQEYVDKISNIDEDQKVKNYLSLCTFEFYYINSKTPDFLISSISDEIQMFEHLNIIDSVEQPYPLKISKQLFIKLKEDTSVCSPYGDKWKIKVYKIQDISILKEIGAYHEALKIIQSMEKVNIRFLNGDYSSLL